MKLDLSDSSKSLLIQHENSVHCIRMKNVTLSAEESLIEQARLVARSENKTLNAAFREWLQQYASRAGRGAAYEALMQRFGDVQPGRHFTRDEMNER
jgi:hypothetical protein